MVIVIFAAAGLNDDLLLYCTVCLVHTTMHFGWLSEEILRPMYHIQTKRASHWIKNWDNPTKMIFRNKNFFFSCLLSPLERAFPHLLGWVPYLTVWVCFGLNFVWNSRDPENGREAPVFVWIILFSQATIFSVFGLVQFFNQVYLDGPRNFYIGELTYILLSFTAKTFLGVTLMTSIFVFDNLSEAFAELTVTVNATSS